MPIAKPSRSLVGEIASYCRFEPLRATVVGLVAVLAVVVVPEGIPAYAGAIAPEKPGGIVTICPGLGPRYRVVAKLTSLASCLNTCIIEFGDAVTVKTSKYPVLVKIILDDEAVVEVVVLVEDELELSETAGI